MRYIHKILTIGIALLVVQCGDLPDEGTLKRKGSSVTIRYNHNKVNLQYDGHSKRLINHHNARAISPLTPVRHNIKVEPNIADIDLNEELSAEVEVPVDTYMTVDYKNWTQAEPEIYYEYGSSNPFIVTHSSPDTVVITISVSINPDYPPDEDETDDETVDNETEEEEETTDNETTDNETTDNETEIIDTTPDTTLLVHLKFDNDSTDSSVYEREFTNCSGYYYPTYSQVDRDNKTVIVGNFIGNRCIENAFRDNSTGTSVWNQTSPLSISDNWTISFWILPDLSHANFDQWHSVMSTGDNTNGQRFQIDHDGNDKLRGPYTVLKVDMEEEWMFFTFTKTTDTSTGDNQKVRVYKNADLKTYSSNVQTLWDKLKIGMNRSGGGGWYGYIDDYRVYSRALTADEVEELYESYE